MDKSPARKVAESYWRAECAMDLEAVVAHYHPEASFSPPGMRLEGHGQIRAFYAESFRRFVGLECEILHEIAHGDESSLEWRAVFTDAAGRRYPLQGVNIARVENGKFREMRAYFDPSILQK